MADERFQDFPEKTTPSGSDELVGVDNTGYFRTPISSLPAGGESLPSFFSGMIGDKVLIVQTGQSNPQGLEMRTAAVGVDTWENPRVWDWQYALRSGAPITGTERSNPADPNWGWVNPTTDQAYPTNFPGGIDASYMGYIGSNTGNQAYALANEIQLATGLDVYVVNLSQGGASVSWWDGSLSVDHAEELRLTLQYILAGSSGVDFGGKPGPDIVSWGQSEANFPAPLSNSYLPPDVWAATVAAIFDLAKSQSDSWVEDGYSQIFLTEATEWVNWTGTPGTGSYAGVPYQWDGANVLAATYGDDCSLVSSRNIPYGVGAGGPGTAPDGTPPTFWIHYTGDGNDEYGRRIADIVLGRAKAFQDTDLERVQVSSELPSSMPPASIPLSGNELVAIEQDSIKKSLTVEAVKGNAIQRDYGFNGLIPYNTCHFLNASSSFNTTTDFTMYGNEKVSCHIGATGSVYDQAAIFNFGVAGLSTGSNPAGGFAGVRHTIWPVFSTTTDLRMRMSFIAGPVEQNVNAERFTMRLGWQQPMGGGVYGQGVYFETRFGQANWLARVQGTSSDQEIDTGIPVTVVNPFGGALLNFVIEYNLEDDENALFYIGGNLVATIDTSLQNMPNLSDVGVSIEKTEGGVENTAWVDFMALEGTIDTLITGVL